MHISQLIKGGFLLRWKLRTLWFGRGRGVIVGFACLLQLEVAIVDPIDTTDDTIRLG
jgi:hypothetical protein